VDRGGAADLADKKGIPGSIIIYRCGVFFCPVTKGEKMEEKTDISSVEET
jgi:hypothetical protein